MAGFDDNLQAPELDQPVLELQAGQEAATTRQQQAIAGGGAVTPITQGGTGAATAAAALSNLGAAPSNATYITRVSEAGLSAEQALSLLATGYMKVTTVTGVVTSELALTPTSVAINGGTAITKIVVYAPNLTPASVAANTSAEQTFPVTGLTTADKVMVNGPAATAGTGIVNVRVSAADTLAILFGNFTAGALTPTNGVYATVAFRS